MVQGDFTPTGLHNKGLLYGLRIGNHRYEPRASGPVDNHDQGVADEPEELGGNLTGICTAKGLHL